jgi:hypothetical protein
MKEKRSLAKTGSGQTQESNLREQPFPNILYPVIQCILLYATEPWGCMGTEKCPDGTLLPPSRKTHLCAPFYTENDHFTKTGLGQT